MTLSTIFEKRLFRIPNYQRGYAWQERQLTEFWEDLINIPEKKKHYTGMITVQEIESTSVLDSEPEYWLVVGAQDFKIYSVVDGQQRLTTSIILIQAIVDDLKQRYPNRETAEIPVSNMILSELVERYLYKQKPNGGLKTFKFGYSADNPSYEFLRKNIFKAESPVTHSLETIYTVNLQNAKRYFDQQLMNLSEERLSEILLSLVTGLVFNFYIIPKDFDVHVAFESMNNRGKKLSNLELLKNRLIYLAQLLPGLETDDRAHLVEKINSGWRTIYHNLGRNSRILLPDDDFLRAHWIIYYKYSRRTGSDYVYDLLDNRFAISKALSLKASHVKLTNFDRVESEDVTDMDDSDPDVIETQAESVDSELNMAYIAAYVENLCKFSGHWYFIHFPSDSNYSRLEIEWLNRLLRIRPAYFPPIIAVIFMHPETEEARISILSKIERFIFLAFRLNSTRSNYGSSALYPMARHYNHRMDEAGKKISIENLDSILQDYINGYAVDGKPTWTKGFEKSISQWAKSGHGFYQWPSLHYFLYEYEMAQQKKVGLREIDWDLFKRHESDKVSIEHIMPQNYENESWKNVFEDYSKVQKEKLCGSLGNLLPLSLSINSSLQDISYKEKMTAVTDADGNLLRPGYKELSLSALELEREYPRWNAKAIRDRGLKLLKFMEGHWNLNLGSIGKKKLLLQVNFVK